MFKVNNKDTRTTPMASLLPLNMYFTSCSSVSTVNFEHVIAGWEVTISSQQGQGVKKKEEEM